MEIQNLNQKTRQKVISYIHDNKMSVNRFAQETKVLQPNMHVFLNGKGLSIKNLEKIWKYFKKKGV
jgi:hypothetical protein